MGYETNLIFVSSGYSQHGKFKGFCPVEATLEMGKIHYGHVGNLIDKTKQSISEKVVHLIEEYNELHDKVFDHEGQTLHKIKELPKEEQQKRFEEVFTLMRKLEEQVPFVYAEGGNYHNFSDNYGDPLLLVSLKDLKKAIKADLKESIKKKEYGKLGYRRFNVALKMIEAFESKQFNDVGVILFGH